MKKHALAGLNALSTQVLADALYELTKQASAYREKTVSYEFCLTGIVRKTVGLKQPLLDALEPIKQKIELAFVYGSVAKGTDTSSSDIDLLIVSDELALADVFSILSPLEDQIGRQVSPTLYNSAEFSDKRKTKRSFIAKVLNASVIELIGSIDE